MNLKCESPLHSRMQFVKHRHRHSRNPPLMLMSVDCSAFFLLQGWILRLGSGLRGRHSFCFSHFVLSYDFLGSFRNGKYAENNSGQGTTLSGNHYNGNLFSRFLAGEFSLKKKGLNDLHWTTWILVNIPEVS